MLRTRFAAAVLSAFLLFSLFASAEEAVQVEEIPLDELLTDPPAVTEPAPAEPTAVFTPSYGSPWEEDLGSSYWTTPMDITDEETVWKMLMEPITVIDLGPKKGYNHSQNTKRNLYMYKEPDENSKIVGEITNLSQGLRVIKHLDNGWSLVECYSSSFAAHPSTVISAWNILVSGYIKSEYLTQVQPTDQLALVVDKLSQRLYVFVEGHQVAELLCSTGLVRINNDGKEQPYNETRSGEFLIINMTGSLKSDYDTCAYAMRFNAGDEIHEVPHRVDPRYDSGDKRGWKYNVAEPYLGKKRSHGCIRVQRLTNPDGINMEWIYKRVKSKDLCGKVKIVIWEDWQGRQLPVPDPDTVLYYNPNKGQYYHSAEHCNMASSITFTPFLYSQLEDEGFAKLKPCNFCVPARRIAEIEAINEEYAPGKDHEELLNGMRQKYYDYLAAE